jgi:catechol 2,3-dioxygenase-like lactoylglutathione lyase family enzyme
VGFHHVAIATRDMQATHRFYTEAMGFRLAKVVAAPTGSPEGGWARHVFYDTGGQGMIAFFELHDPAIPSEFDPAISTGLGLPPWVNHLAFDAGDLEGLEAACRRWQAFGLDVVELDHGFCRSIYATDPNGVLVEFACTTRPLDEEDARIAAELLADPTPPLDPLPVPTFHLASELVAAGSEERGAPRLA